ncbi:hypothetical protein SAMN04488081_2005 [Salimicrobium album]|uniref:Uncharacterized protein n=2 Tax=Salimicrobium TaxID=351195 RepID=A0ABY1L389_9BACI|nr:hypothetical protein SAMN04488081_2005 [Salimicrobium album]SIS98490.1 hypothetical protein SAMN05421758_11617 [Salimicrobium salexigens]
MAAQTIPLISENIAFEETAAPLTSKVHIVQPFDSQNKENSNGHPLLLSIRLLFKISMFAVHLIRVQPLFLHDSKNYSVVKE